MTLQKVHPGGFFWNVARADRDQVVLRLATETKKLAIVAHSEPAAKSFAERLTLSGLPVFCATDSSRSDALADEISHGTITLVTTHDFVMSHGPIRVPLAVHLQAPRSVRVYARRLEAVPAAVHITFVTPDDVARAEALTSYLRNDRGHEQSDEISLGEVIDLTESGSTAAASVSTTRRRFPHRN